MFVSSTDHTYHTLWRSIALRRQLPAVRRSCAIWDCVIVQVHVRNVAVGQVVGVGQIGQPAAVVDSGEEEHRIAGHCARACAVFGVGGDARPLITTHALPAAASRL